MGYVIARRVVTYGFHSGTGPWRNRRAVRGRGVRLNRLVRLFRAF
jgi:hypothetical protein